MTELYLACFRHNVGSNIGWPGFNGKGYTTNVDQAHVYTLEQAQVAWDNARSIDQPIAVHHVRKHIVWKVDYQYIPSISQIDDPYIKYVALDVIWQHKRKLDIKVLNFNNIVVNKERLQKMIMGELFLNTHLQKIAILNLGSFYKILWKRIKFY